MVALKVFEIFGVGVGGGDEYIMQKQKDGHTFGLHITRSSQPERVYLQLPVPLQYLLSTSFYTYNTTAGDKSKKISNFSAASSQQLKQQ